MVEKGDHLEMAKALYQFKATIAKTLSFREGEYFIIYEPTTKQRNWWQVINSKAQVGYVPSNYVMSMKVSPEYLCRFIDDCISVLRRERDESDGCLPSERQEVLLKLLGRRELLVQIFQEPNDATKKAETRILKQVSPTFKESSAVNGLKQTVSKISGQVGASQLESLRHGNICCDSSVQGRQSPINPLTESISNESVFQLVEEVRCHTELSHEKSRVAVNVVLNDLEKYFPDNEVIRKMLHLLRGPVTAPEPMIEHTRDAKRLKVIFSELTSCKDDAQQRSWMLHEDEDVIIDYIKELTSILVNADHNISRYVISSDQYTGVIALAQYYQMEVRWSIRQPLLQALGVLCSLDRAIINIFLFSVLPMELARDMKANSRNIPKLNYSALLLTMIFSMGEAMPITHLEHLGPDFINFIFNHIENPPDTDVDDQIPDLFVTLILSYNLQFRSINDNILLKTIVNRNVAKTFTEKILLLLNREDDPVRIFDHEPAPQHSVLKLFIDMFSVVGTADLFYTNDVKVLIDIIVRQLADLSPGDQKRHQYLELCRVVMRNSGYSEHHHRQDDLLKCFTRIFCEETEVSLKDQQLVREISNEFPQYFKS
ncbi:UNVERIFIED_CONTAM: hypothetical protein PYX00_005141 [Menopon gallinae]|uniref:SH3 domain-containing protein n=1 Tax=Menopon gallinae TaxID=328185 RepID=A0AAW2HRL9_9NEOP